MSMGTILTWIFFVLAAGAVYEGVSWSPSAFHRGVCVYRRTEVGWKALDKQDPHEWLHVRGIILRWLTPEHALFRVNRIAWVVSRRMPAGILLGELTFDEAGAGHVVLKVPLSAVLLLLVIAVGLALAAAEGTSPPIAYAIGFFLLCCGYILLCLIDAVALLYGIEDLKA